MVNLMRCANFRWVSLATTVTVGVTNVWCNLQRRGVFFSAQWAHNTKTKSLEHNLELLLYLCLDYIANACVLRWIVNQKSDKTFGFDRVEWPKPSPRRWPSYLPLRFRYWCSLKTHLQFFMVNQVWPQVKHNPFYSTGETVRVYIAHS